MDAVVSDVVIKLLLEILPPTYNVLAIAAPPAVVKVPPFVVLVASVVNEIPIPPDKTIAPVELDVEAVALVNVATPEDPIVVAPEIPPERVKLVRVPTEVILL